MAGDPEQLRETRRIEWLKFTTIRPLLTAG